MAAVPLIQANISAPCTVLDFPTREIFARELQSQRYDIVGISSIIVNVGASALRAMEHKLRQTNAAVTGTIRGLLQEIERALGPLAALSGGVLAP